ncbi:MAG: formate dehydrogenase [Gammaproteobacteria bacterium]|nr:formate dehydrogenase [Gammaproteobacteria bacterium]
MSKPTRIYLPADSAALALGADALAKAIAAEALRLGQSIEIIRTGSRGMHWLEPLVEVATPTGRIGYGPVGVADVAGLFAAEWLQAGEHALCIGQVEAHKFLRRQDRWTFARCGIVDPLSWRDFIEHGGGQGLAWARANGPAATLAAVTASGLRGRGGAGFPAGIKWRTVHDTSADIKYVVCNADEGDSGTFADRMLMEGDPFALLEGMAVCALAVGARKGFIYIRSEYPRAITVLEGALIVAREQGLLTDCDIELRIGAGAYVCGEETALLESLEGKRGQVRAKPPLPAHRGLFGKPTVVNNVLTLATVPAILTRGAEAYAALGSGKSRGTIPIQLAGNIRHGGLFEVPFGISLHELIDEVGAGTASGRPVRAVQVGGPLGAYFPRDFFDTALDYEAFTAREGLVGHGGIVVFDDSVDMSRQARFAMEFCAAESCGKCTPCRVGSVRGMEVIDKILSGREVDENLVLLEDLCNTLRLGSLCALGGFVPFPVLSALRHFPQDFRRS